MTQEYYTLVTDIGIAKFTNAQITQRAVNLTHIAVGDGDGAIYNPTQSQTALKNERWRGQVSTVEVDDENENYINIETTIPGTVGGWMIREAGVFDDEGDLILISKQPETFKPTFGQGSVKDMIIKLVMELSNTDVAAIKIDPTIITASRSYVAEQIEPINKAVSKIDIDIAALKNQKANKDDVDLLVHDKVTKKELDETNKNVEKKSDKTYVDGLIGGMTFIKPRDVYYSIEALETALPNGDEGLYLVYDSSFTDGAHGYIWSESESYWKDTGLWQSKGIADSSVTPKSTTFIEAGMNMFNPHDIIIGKSLNTDTGELVDQSGTCVSKDFIDVPKNVKISLKKPAGVVLYNNLNERIASFGQAAQTFNTGNAVKMKLFMNLSNVYEQSVVQGDVAISDDYGLSLQHDNKNLKKIAEYISSKHVKKSNDEYNSYDFLELADEFTFSNAVGYKEYNKVWRTNESAIKLMLTGLSTSGYIQGIFSNPLAIEGISELVLVLYIDDISKINSINLQIFMSDETVWSSSRTKTQMQQGWNIVRLPAAHSNFGEWTNFTRYRLHVYTTGETSVYLSKVTAVQPHTAKLLFVNDHGYSNFKNYAYPKLSALGIPTTWGLNPGRLGSSAGILTQSEIDKLALDSMSSFNMHTWDPTQLATENMTVKELRDDTIKCMRYIQKHGLQPRYWWRAVFVGNKAKNAVAIRDLVDAYSTPTEQASSELFPFLNPWNVVRMGVHGRDAQWYDTQLNILKKTRCLHQWYTHDVNDNDPIDMKYAEVDLMIEKLTAAMSEGWLEGITYESLRTRYDRIFTNGDLAAYVDTF